MTGQEFLEKVLASYEEAFDITRPFDAGGDIYDAYAAFNVTSAKYVLVEKAELWRASCYEHTFFKCCPSFAPELLDGFRRKIEEYIEPEIVRQGLYGKRPYVYLYHGNFYL